MSSNHRNSTTETFADKANRLNKNLDINLTIDHIEIMNPFKNLETLRLTETFYQRYFDDFNQRFFLFGINPGRFGAGITGISFTDPINLEKACGIKNNFDKRPELSSRFIYQVIAEYGGTLQFYSKFFITSVCPLGFVRNGINLNYYDSRELSKTIRPFIIESINKQISLGAHPEICICIGGNKNFAFLRKLNEAFHFFDEIIPLEHPRYIMQYRKKFVDEYVKKYLDALKICEQETNA